MLSSEIKWACINRLDAAIASKIGLGYPQAASDVRIALLELHHFKADSEFLREEKARVWGAQVTFDPLVDRAALSGSKRGAGYGRWTDPKPATLFQRMVVLFLFCAAMLLMAALFGHSGVFGG